MKKVLSILLSVAIFATMTTFSGMSAFALSTYTTDDGNYTFTTSTATNTNATITKYNGTDTDVVIPATLTSGDKTATTYVIAATAFSGNNSITSVKVPALSTSASSFPQKVFQNCTSLESVDLSDLQCKTIPNYAFDGCTKLNNITFQSGVTAINQYAFQNCLLTDLNTLPSTVKTIGNYAFSGSGLSSITLPTSVTTVGTYAFKDCSVLDTLNLNSYSKAMPVGIIDGCSSLTHLALSAGTTSVTSSIFTGCTSLKAITLPTKMTSLEVGAIPTSIESVSYPDNCSMTSVAANLFDGYTSLKSVSFGTNSKIATIGASAFAATLITDFTVPASVTSSDNAFAGMELQKLALGNGSNITTLSDAFGGNIPSTFNHVTVSAGVINDNAFANTNIAYVTLGSVTGIGASAFENCSNIASITLPSTLTSIGANAFKGTSLTSVDIPASVASIGNSAFDGCSVSSVTIPASVLTMTGALKGVNGLTSVTFASGNNITSLSDIFDGIVPSTLTDITVSSGAVGYNVFANTDISNVTLNGVTSIGASAFENCSNISSITLPSTLTSIGANAFKGTSLTSVSIPSSVTSIAANAFDGCSIENITIPSSLTKMTGAFAGVTGLKTLTIENAAKFTSISDLFGNTTPTFDTLNIVGGTIAANAFEGTCAKTINVGEGVGYISENAFANCPNLTSIVIANESVGIFENASTISNNGTSFAGTIYGYAGSSAEDYANKYSKAFENINCSVNGHQWVDTVVAPTCVASGYTVHACSVCGKQVIDTQTPATGHHDFGSNLKYCAVCNTVNPSYKESSTAGTVTTTVAKVNNKPAATSVKKLTKKSKSFKVTYKKVSAARGYEIQYSTSKKFTKKTTKTVTVKGATKTSKTIKGLKSKKKYYVRVRTYNKVNGKFYKSSWSSVKTVTTKK